MKGAKKDYYRVLQVSKDATQEDIKRAYRRLAREYHPDMRPGDKDAEEKLKEINEAYEVLGNPESRREYDRTRTRVHIRRGSSQRTRSHRESTWDLFEFLFGEPEPTAHRTPSREEMPKGRTYEAQVTLDFEEAYRGKEITLTVEGRRVRVPIPPGVRDGMTLRIPGAGGRSVFGGLPGDLLVRVHVRSHPQFRVEGENIVVDADVDLFTALLGGVIRVAAPDGLADLVIPPGTQPNSMLRVPGRGMPSPADPRVRGDLLVHVHVHLPRRLTSEEQELIRKWKRLRDRESSS